MESYPAYPANRLLLHGYSTRVLQALGNASLDSMEAGGVLFRAVWRSAPGTVLLYGAGIIHLGLGLWALYRRRLVGWPRAEIVQAALGVAIPLLVLPHVVILFVLVFGWAVTTFIAWLAILFTGRYPASLQGFGIGVLPTALIAQEVGAGRLVTLLDAYERVDSAIEIRIAYSTRALLPAKVRAFVEHAVRFCADEGVLSGEPKTGLQAL